MTNQVRDLLAKALPDSQPTSLTPQQLLAAGRRQRVRRRVGYLGGGTAAVALVAAGGLLLPALPGPDRPPGPASPPPPDAVVAQPGQPPIAIEELSDQIRALFAAAEPDLQLLPGERGGEPFDLRDPGDDPNNLAELWGAAYLETSQGGRVGWAEIRLYRPGPWSDEPGTTEEDHYLLEDPIHNPALISCWSGSFEVTDDSDPPITSVGIVETQCDTSTTADGGELITVHGEEYFQGQPRHRYSRSWNTVVAFRPDGTAVKAGSFCGNEDVDDDENNHCFDLQFTIDQLTSIVANTPPVPAE